MQCDLECKVFGDVELYDSEPTLIHAMNDEELGTLVMPPRMPIFRGGEVCESVAFESMYAGDCVFMDRDVYESCVKERVTEIPYGIYEGVVTCSSGRQLSDPVLIPVNVDLYNIKFQ